MEAIRFEEQTLFLLDQLKLPSETIWIPCTDGKSARQAIAKMQVRGAPAIGITAAFSLYLESLRAPVDSWLTHLESFAEYLLTARPTAVNLKWAVEEGRKFFAVSPSLDGLQATLRSWAQALHADDIERCRKIGDHGCTVLAPGSKVLTHCNTGSLATGGHGTALGIIRSARDRIDSVWVDETRPFLQGSRLTAYELEHENIPYKVVTDNMAGHLMQQGLVDAVIVGADRITADGSVANKIGTYSLAVLARFHNVDFIVAAPLSTLDLAMTSGEDIPIEHRDPKEVVEFHGHVVAPENAIGFHPAFDVTPSELVTYYVTEEGVFQDPESLFRPLLQEQL